MYTNDERQKSRIHPFLGRSRLSTSCVLTRHFISRAIVDAGLPPYIGGLIGLDLLGQFEIEFDFSTSSLSFWPKGAIANGALSVDDLVKIPMRKHPVGLKTVRCSLNGAEPFDAIVDAVANPDAFQ
jgi:hypothetical protein